MLNAEAVVAQSFLLLAARDVKCEIEIVLRCIAESSLHMTEEDIDIGIFIQEARDYKTEIESLLAGEISGTDVGRIIERPCRFEYAFLGLPVYVAVVVECP